MSLDELAKAKNERGLMKVGLGAEWRVLGAILSAYTQHAA